MFLAEQLEKLRDEKDKFELLLPIQDEEVLEKVEKENCILKDHLRELIEQNSDLSEKLEDSVDRGTMEKLHLATKELLKQNDELNVENETLLSEINNVTSEKQKLEEQIETQSSSTDDGVFKGQQAQKRVQFNLSNVENGEDEEDSGMDTLEGEGRKILISNNPSSRELVVCRPYARDIIEQQLTVENTHLFAVNTKLFSEREKLKEQLFKKNIELNDNRAIEFEEKKQIRSKLTSQRSALQRLRSVEY